MDFGQAVSTGFSKYVNFRDRACRSEYWYWALFWGTVTIVTSIIDAVLDPNLQLATALFTLATIIPYIAVGIRRLHDLDQTGWWYLLSLIPLAGGILLAIWFMFKGTDGPNRFGPDPLAPRGLWNQQFEAPA